MRVTLPVLGIGVFMALLPAQSTLTQSPVAPPPAAAPVPTVANVDTPVLTPAERDAVAKRVAVATDGRLRARLTAQVAVLDDAEQQFRAPTAAESAALAPSSAGDSAAAVDVPSGGIAVRGDASQLSRVMAVVEDGQVVVRHTRAAAPRASKGGDRER